MKPQTHTKRSTGYCRFKNSLLWMGSLLAFAGAALPESASAAFSGGAAIWGQNNNSQQAITAPPSGVTYVDIGVSDYSGVGLRSDGQITGWGNDSWGQLDAP